MDKTYKINGETWKHIKGFEEYLVSNKGNVYSLGRIVVGVRPTYRQGRLLKKTLGKQHGYYYVAISKDGVKNNHYVHRLVMEAFSPNPENHPCINHKDEVKTNNLVGNLEWCTYSYNTNYGGCTEKLRNSHKEKGNLKKIKQFSLSGEFIQEHESIKAAARSLGDVEKRHGISGYLRGRNGAKSAYGFLWEHAKTPVVC